MPRALPAELESAMDSGSFKTYVALGERTYPGPSITTLITSILYYKYDGQNLTVKWSSPNMPADDGMILGDKYHIERGVTIAGVNYTIKSAELRFDDYTIDRQVITGTFSLFSADEKPTATIAGDDTYTNVLTTLNPNSNGTVDFKATPENADHWGYQFYPAGKQVILKSYAAALPHIRQKYLIEATDNSDDDNENEVQYYHLSSRFLQWEETGTIALVDLRSITYAPSLDLFVAVANDTGSPFQPFATSPDGATWTLRSFSEAGTFKAVCWSEELTLFVAVGTADIATSPDGITWTKRTAANANQLFCVEWISELSLFVAGGGTGSDTTSTKAIQTSPDGINWTEQTTPAHIVRDIAYSPTLNLIAAVGYYTGVGARIISSPDAATWTTRETTGQFNAVAWSSDLSLFVVGGQNAGNAFFKKSLDGLTWTSATIGGSLSSLNFIADIVYHPTLRIFVAVGSDNQTDPADKCATTDTGENWIARDITSHEYRSLVWVDELSRLYALWGNGASGGVFGSSEDQTFDHTITRGDVVLMTNNKPLQFLWRDEAETIHTAGIESGTVHNLGYLESTDLPPNNFENTGRAKVTTGIHLKYKTGDIFKLAINATQYAIYHARVTEILDPNAEIGWRCEIELIERFANTNGGALPSTIERVAAYTPLVTTNFDGNLDETVNNLQAFADRVDDMVMGGYTQEEIEDFIGAMFSGNTETGIAATYDDTNGKINLVAEVTQSELDTTNTNHTNHLSDSSDAHDASAISIADAGGYFTGTDVEAALQELGAGGGGGGREVLAANRTYYVRTDGSDSNNGLTDSSGGAFLTIQKAVDVVYGTLDLYGYDVTIQVRNGTFAGANVLFAQVGKGTITIQGDTTTPSNVLINTGGFAAYNYCTVKIQGFKIAGPTTAILAQGAYIKLGAMDYGACSFAHMLSVGGSGLIEVIANYSITGNSGSHHHSSNGGWIEVAPTRTITLTGTPAFTQFALSQSLGQIRNWSNTFSGSATGKRYAADMNAIIQTFGGGANYFPGNAVGTTATGGQYA